MKKQAVAISMVAGLVACGGGGGGGSGGVTTEAAPGALGVALSAAAFDVPVSICPNGGAKIDTGVDRNANGVLDALEITSTSHVCNGAAGLTSLVDLQTEAAGANCATGGTKVLAGSDKNADGVLAPTEVTSTRYTCGTAASGGDVTKPQITTTAPLVATSNQVQFTTTTSDDVELALVGSAGQSSNTFVLPEGVKEHTLNDTLPVALTRTATKTLVAVDTSGNTTKKTVTISSPPIAAKLGSYTVEGVVSLPTGFDCLTTNQFPFTSLTGVVGAVTLGTSVEWSVAGGYWPTLGVGVVNGSTLPGSFGAGGGGTGTFSPVLPLNTPAFPANVRAALSDTTFAMDSVSNTGSGGIAASYARRNKATVVPVAGVPGQLQFTISTACTFNGGAWVEGTPLTFKASPTL